MDSDTPCSVSIVAVPEATHSTVAGLADVLGIFRFLGRVTDAMPSQPPFRVQFVGLPNGAAAALPFTVKTTIDEVDSADIVIVPSLMVSTIDWSPGAYPEVVEWLRTMHTQGATLCSTCSGGLLLAETGLLRGREATTHWAYAEVFQRHFPDVRLRLERLLVTSGPRSDILMSGASGSWHDLVLHLIAERVSPAAAQTVARFLLLDWHPDGQLAYIMFVPNREHGDAVILDAPDWLERHLAAAAPVEEMTHRSGLSARTFKRRFVAATGLGPIKYVHQVRIEAAKGRLERTNAPIDEIAWQIGYEEPAFFRRLFKRTTGITPGAYRRKLQVPDRRAQGVMRTAGIRHT